MDSIERMLSMLLGGAVETLDIPPDLQRQAIERYEGVSAWLAEHGGVSGLIYPQGSFSLGTVVRPNTRTGDFDIDLVFTLLIAKTSTTQADLKQRVGDLLLDYVAWKQNHYAGDGPKSCAPSRRCWTLGYPGFHLDVLPTIPDADYPPTGILLTDLRLREWQHSNPKGYVAWFGRQSDTLRRHASEYARANSISVDDVPVFTVRTTLQRAVQVLKWHCMLHFATDPDNRPPSILLTTLAAKAYGGEDDLFLATYNIVRRMADFIENRNGVAWVANPAHEEENFADKWSEYPSRRQAFYAWLHDITEAMHEVSRMGGKGIHIVAESMIRSGFGRDPITRSLEMLGNQTRQLRASGLRVTGTGLLTTAAVTGPRVREHTFYGDRASPRRQP